MRLAQLRTLSCELTAVHPPGAPASGRHEEAVHLQDSDRRLMLEGVKSMALAIGTAASPIDTYALDQKAKNTMRDLAARFIAGKAKAKAAGQSFDEWLADKARTADERLSKEQLVYFNVRRPHALMRLPGVQRLQRELEGLEDHIRKMSVSIDQMSCGLGWFACLLRTRENI